MHQHVQSLSILAIALLLLACAPESDSTPTVIVPSVDATLPTIKGEPEMSQLDRQLTGRWELLHTEGFDTKTPVSFVIEDSDSPRWGQRYIANLGGSFTEIEIDGDRVSFSRGAYATAAGRKLDLRIRYDYEGVIKPDAGSMSGTATRIGRIDQYGEPLPPDHDDRVFPAIDQGFAIQTFSWSAQRISDKD